MMIKRIALTNYLYLIFWTAFFVGLLYLPKLPFFQQKQTINIVTWSDLIDSTYIERFEKESGIKVNVSYFENNEELLVKLKAAGKSNSYDLIVLSDYIIKELIESDFLKPIDKSRLDFWQRLDKRFLNLPYDKGSTYTIPYSVPIYGIGINKAYFGDDYDPSWGLIFNKQGDDYRVGMLDNPREVITLVARYLFGNKPWLEAHEIEQLRKLLFKQKEFVCSYSEFRADYLLFSDSCQAAVITTPNARRLMKTVKGFDFVSPREGAMLMVDSFVIPKASQKNDLAYKFLNFIYKPSSLNYHFDNFPFFPATTELKSLLSKDVRDKSLYQLYFNSSIPLYHFIPPLDQTAISSLWIKLKAS